MFGRAWTVHAGIAPACKGTLLDWEALPEGDPLRGVARSYGLGLHIKGGAGRAGAL